MDKTKTSKKRKSSLKVTSLKSFKSNDSLFLDRKLIAEVLVESILNNDLETFRDVLVTHLRTMSKTDLAKKTGLGRQTLYDLLSEEKFDPRLSTLSALLSKIAG